MNTFAYCMQSSRHLVSRAAGVLQPTTCPPTTMETLDLSLFSGREFVYVKLHGLEGERYWYGDNYTTALSAGQLARVDLSSAVVFTANCWLMDNDGNPGPMLEALTQADARAIIGGGGTNWAFPARLAGTDLLGLYIRFFLQVGFAAKHALELAKLRLQLKRPDKATADTLKFRIWS